MNDDLLAEESVNQAFEPVLMRSIHRFRALLPSEVELALDVEHDNPRIRAHAQPLEDAMLSACLVAWQSMAGMATQIVIKVREVLLDDVVLDPDAEKLQGGAAAPLLRLAGHQQQFANLSRSLSFTAACPPTNG